LENPLERNYLGGLGKDESIILKWMSKKWGVRVQTALKYLRIGPLVGCCEHDNDLLSSIKGREFITS
jgi:hypothetical protein